MGSRHVCQSAQITLIVHNDTSGQLTPIHLPVQNVRRVPTGIAFNAELSLY